MKISKEWQDYRIKPEHKPTDFLLISGGSSKLPEGAINESRKTSVLGNEVIDKYWNIILNYNESNKIKCGRIYNGSTSL